MSKTTANRISPFKNRRMFSNDVTDTDSFLDLPHSSQVLWWQCGMRADDDGFISNIKTILKITNTTTDDLLLLLLKGYLIELENAQMHKKVYLFAHWKLCNSVRKDRYAQSEHVHLLENVVQSDFGVYQKTIENPSLFGNFAQNSGIPMVRIGKVRLGKVTDICSLVQFEEFWKYYPKKVNKKRAMKEWEKAKIPQEQFEAIIQHIKQRSQTEWVKDNKAYVVYPERFIKDERWNDDISSYKPLVETTADSLDLSSK